MTSKKSHPLYVTWYDMMSRCYRSKDMSYRYYGARGITVCERWRIFSNFTADMGERPHRHTLERINNNRGYEPGNCRWATRQEQASNTTKVVRIEAKGSVMTIPEWSKRLGVHVWVLRYRARKLGSFRAAIEALS